MGNNARFELRESAIWVYAVGTIGAAAAAYFLSAALRSTQLQQSEEEDDIPDEYKDPITYEVMSDPVVLCGTGQVYDYQSLRTWLAAGNYRCPRTNLQLLDVQVSRLPWLRHSILDWLKQHGHPLPADPHQAIADIEGLQPDIATYIRAMRSESGRERLNAATLLAYKYRKWQDVTCDADVETQLQQAAVRACVMDDLVWMVRYGEPALQGAAASLLACCKLDEELAWLAATALVPLLAMLNSHSRYAQEWALQVLYNICLRVPSSRLLLWQAGCAQALLQLVSKPRSAVGFHRDRAAVTLATLAGLNSEVKDWLKKHGALPLATLLLTTNDRWEQRDAAYALMTLQLDTQQLQAAAAQVLAQHQALLHSRIKPEAAGLVPASPTSDSGSGTGSCSSSAAPAAVADAEAQHAGNGTSSSSSAGRQGTECIAATALTCAAAAGAGDVAAPRPCAELLQQGLGSIHELLGRYRWCSDQYLNGQADAPDAGLTAAELAARQSYEEALAQYREALAERQQQADEMQQPELEHAHLAGEVPANDEQQQQEQQQEQQQQEQQQQEQPHDAVNQRPQQQQLPVQPLAQEAAAAQAVAEQQRQQQHQVQGCQQQQRLRGSAQQQQPRHWMAEHDAHGSSENLLYQGLDGSSSGSDAESEGNESSSDDSDASGTRIEGVMPDERWASPQ